MYEQVQLLLWSCGVPHLITSYTLMCDGVNGVCIPQPDHSTGILSYGFTSDYLIIQYFCVPGFRCKLKIKIVTVSRTYEMRRRN